MVHLALQLSVAILGGLAVRLLGMVWGGEVSQEMGGGRLAKKAIGRWEVLEFWTRMWQVWILPVS